MTDATILVPTFRHPELLPYALRSALEQRGAEVEVLVVGDGVEDATRAAVEPFLADPRVRFFDFPKGERHGERPRHEALRDARGEVVAYLSDDDLLLPDHVAEMMRLLDGADLVHSAPFVVRADGSLWFLPIDLARPEFQALLRGSWNAIVLTGTAHTLAAYRRLPGGWRPAPPGTFTDHYMWRQFVELDGFRGRTATRLTHLHFPDNLRRDVATAQRVAELESWWNRVHEPGFAEELERACADEARRVAVSREISVQELRRSLEWIQGTRWWRLRSAVARVAPSRALRSRSPEAR